VKTGSVELIPKAVESSSSEGAFSDAEEVAAGGLSCCMKRG
jgi:hypothetical protein